MASKAQSATLEELVACFEDLEDPRWEVNRKHPLVSVVLISIMAVLGDQCGTARDTETLECVVSPLKESRYTVPVCSPQPAAAPKTPQSASFVSADTAGGVGIGTSDCVVLILPKRRTLASHG